MTKLASQLPKGSTNGIDEIAQQLVDAPHKTHLVIGMVDCKETKYDHDNEVEIPTARFRAIEVITGVNARTAKHLLQEAYARRTGQDSLTLDQLEDTTVTIRHGEEEVTTTASDLLKHGSGVYTGGDQGEGNADD